jgi:hypothetical protein
MGSRGKSPAYQRVPGKRPFIEEDTKMVNANKI